MCNVSVFGRARTCYRKNVKKKKKCIAYTVSIYSTVKVAQLVCFLVNICYVEIENAIIVYNSFPNMWINCLAPSTTPGKQSHILNLISKAIQIEISMKMRLIKLFILLLCRVRCAVAVIVQD